MTSPPTERQIRRRALVTGGAVRVGRAIALALAAAGFDVAIAFHRSTAAARGTVRDVERLGGRAHAVRADLRDARAARPLVARAVRALGGLDVLVNSAALFYRTPLATATRAQWNELIDLNLRAASSARRRRSPACARAATS
jgi:NAD(P)-dependent dehydrogenase (short-subunit alcohol dehydrogenase family)